MVFRNTSFFLFKWFFFGQSRLIGSDESKKKQQHTTHTLRNEYDVKFPHTVIFFLKTNKASIFRVPGSLHIGLALIWIGRMIVCMCGLMLSIPLSMPYTWPPYNTSSICKLDTLFCCCCCCSLHFFLSCAFVTFVAAAFFPPARALRWWTHFYFVRLQFLFLTTYFTLSVMHRMSVWVSLCLCSIIFTNRKVAST